jgi:hypothetical protein
MTVSALLPFAVSRDVLACLCFPSHIFAYAGFQFSEIDVGTVEHFQGQEQMKAERRTVSVKIFSFLYALSWFSKIGQARLCQKKHVLECQKNDTLLSRRSVESLFFRQCEAVSMQRSGHCRIVLVTCSKWRKCSARTSTNLLAGERRRQGSAIKLVWKKWGAVIGDFNKGQDHTILRNRLETWTYLDSTLILRMLELVWNDSSSKAAEASSEKHGRKRWHSTPAP